MAEGRQFVLVGHCGPDMHMLRSAIMRAVPGAAVAFANSMDELEPYLKSDAVLLINRVLEYGFETDSGIEMIAEFSASQPSPVMLLISNLAEAQDQAVATGARRGFGKASVHAESTTVLLREVAASSVNHSRAELE